MKVAFDMLGTFQPAGLGHLDDAHLACLVLDRRLAHADHSGGIGRGLHRVGLGEQGCLPFVPSVLSHGHASL